MKIIEYISYMSIPLMLFIILYCAWRKKINAYEIFLNGAIDGMKIILKIFPTMIGIFVAVNLLRVTGTMDLLIQVLKPITYLLKIPVEIVPLGIMSSISGGASIRNIVGYFRNVWCG